MLTQICITIATVFLAALGIGAIVAMVAVILAAIESFKEDPIPTTVTIAILLGAVATFVAVEAVRSGVTPWFLQGGG